jgi:hypothetical protein
MQIWRLLTLGLLAAGAGAVQSAAAQTEPKEPERLFRSREVLDLTLTAPLKTLFKNRDTVNKKPQTGLLSFADSSGTAVSFPVTLETRGHFRLKPSTCKFPPIKVIFDKEAMKDTPFRGQGSLKLATHCHGAKSYEQDLLVEESIYRMYNLLTPLSHRTRLARIRYVPTEDTTETETKYGFFLEDDDELAKRNGGTWTKVPGLALSDMEPATLDLSMVFLYMIGNTDWSILMLHNMRVVQVEGQLLSYPVAYDFDFSGLVGAPYAAPDARLPIKSVQTRLYRGVCREPEELAPTFDRFKAQRDAIYAVLDSQPGLEPKRAQEARDYLGGFFKQIERPRDFNNALGYACRGR